jgi:hypothetical protein
MEDSDLALGGVTHIKKKLINQRVDHFTLVLSNRLRLIIIN